MMSEHYTIQQLSKEFEITPRTLRFYEEKGMLKPQRNGQNRIYSVADRSRLRLILRGKRLGFTLQESQELIAMYQPQTSNQQQLQAVLEKIQEKKALLQAQLADIETMQQDLDVWEQRYSAALTNK